ncbi:hypothetical protein ABPG74_005700 [Tetrahymena malaccensis]
MYSNSVTVYTPEEIFMTQMKFTYFLMQACFAGSVICFVFKLIVFGVLALQAFFLFVLYANILRNEYCKTHSVIRSQGEFMMWKVSHLFIYILSAFILFNIIFTIIFAFLDSASQDNAYFESLIDLFSDQKILVSILAQLLCISIQSIIIYMFFFRKSFQLAFLQPDAIVAKMVIRDLSKIPEDRNECLICLEDMKCSGQKQYEHNQQNHLPAQLQDVLQTNFPQNSNTECCALQLQNLRFNPAICSPQEQEKEEDKKGQPANQNFNPIVVKIGSSSNQIKDVENNKMTTQFSQFEIDAQKNEEDSKIPSLNIEVLKKQISNNRDDLNGVNKSLQANNNVNYFDCVLKNFQSCNSLSNMEFNVQKMLSIKTRKYSQKYQQFDCEKSTRWESQYRQDTLDEQSSNQIESQSSNYKPDILKAKENYQENQNQEKNLETNLNQQINNQQPSENEINQENTSNIQQNETPQQFDIESKQPFDSQSKRPIQHLPFQNQQIAPLVKCENISNEKQELKIQQQKIVGFKCNHYFHLNCVQEWLKTSKSLKCPTCRQDIMC